MARVVQPIAATVDAIGKVRDGEHGTYCPCKFATDGEPVWKNLPPGEASKLHKGQAVWLVPSGERNGKASHQIMLRHSQPSEAKAIEFSAQQKHEIASYLNQQGDLLRYCWTVAQSRLDGIATEEASIRAAASTLFISVQRKFGV